MRGRGKTDRSRRAGLEPEGLRNAARFLAAAGRHGGTLAAITGLIAVDQSIAIKYGPR